MLPGSAYVELAYAAAMAVHGNPPAALEDLTFDKMFLVPTRSGQTLQILLLPHSDGTADFAVSQRESGPAGVPVRHATASILCQPAAHSIEALADAYPVGTWPRGSEMSGAAFTPGCAPSATTMAQPSRSSNGSGDGLMAPPRC